MALMFDMYTVFQHFQLQRLRKEFAERDEVFRLITESAAHMIAVIDAGGKWTPLRAFLMSASPHASLGSALAWNSQWCLAGCLSSRSSRSDACS
jgi:hypothetical protein